MSSSKSKDTYLSSLYHRLVARRGKKKASVAVAHSLLIIVYHMIKHNTPYQELGADYLTTLNAVRFTHHHIKILETLGFKVTLEPMDKAA